MKKLALILALMIIPCSAFGLEMLNDNTMDGITGQSGVSIAVDDVQMFINIDKMAYIDCDGYSSLSGYGTCSGAPGAIALNNFQIDVLNINAIVSMSTSDQVFDSDGTTVLHESNQTVAAGGYTNEVAMELYSASCGRIPLFFDYGSMATDGCYLGTGDATQTRGLNNFFGGIDEWEARAITIDVTDALPALSQGKNENLLNSPFSSLGPVTVGGVLIGIPTVEIYINYLSFTPVYDGDISGTASQAANDDTSTIPAAMGKETADFGTIALQGITFTTLGGWIEIAPH